MTPMSSSSTLARLVSLGAILALLAGCTGGGEVSTANGGIDTVCDPSDTIETEAVEFGPVDVYDGLDHFFDSEWALWIEIRPDALKHSTQWVKKSKSGGVNLVVPGEHATSLLGEPLDAPVWFSSSNSQPVLGALSAGLPVVVIVAPEVRDLIGPAPVSPPVAGDGEWPSKAFKSVGYTLVELDGRLIAADPCAQMDDWLTELAAEHGLSLRGLAEQAMREGPDGEVAGWLDEWDRSGAGRATSTTSDGDGVSGSSSTSAGLVLWEDRAPGERSYLDPDARVEPEDRPVEVGVVMDGSVAEWVVARDAVKGVRGRWGLCSRTEVAFGSCWGLGMVEGCVGPSDGSAEEVCRRSPNQLRVLVAPGMVTEVLLRYESFSGVGGPVDWVVGRVESPPGEGEELVLVAPAGWAGLDDGAQRAALDAAAAGDGEGGGAGGWSLVTRPVGG